MTENNQTKTTVEEKTVQLEQQTADVNVVHNDTGIQYRNRACHS